MASQVIGGAVSQLQLFEIHSLAVMGEMVVVKIESTNRHDILAVAIYRDTEIVGHVSYNLAPRMSAFLMREQSI